MCDDAAGCAGGTAQDTEHVGQRWPAGIGIGHWHVCQPGNILAIIFAFEPHYNGNYTQQAAATQRWPPPLHPFLCQVPAPAWYPWHPQHPRQCHVKRQRAQPNVGLTDGRTDGRGHTDAYNSDGRQSTLTSTLTPTLLLTLMCTSTLSLTGVTALLAAPSGTPAMAHLPLPSMRIANTLPKCFVSCIPFTANSVSIPFGAKRFSRLHFMAFLFFIALYFSKFSFLFLFIIYHTFFCFIFFYYIPYIFFYSRLLLKILSYLLNSNYFLFYFSVLYFKHFLFYFPLLYFKNVLFYFSLLYSKNFIYLYYFPKNFVFDIRTFSVLFLFIIFKKFASKIALQKFQLSCR